MKVTNNDGMFSEINVKLQYIMNNNTNTGMMKLNKDDSLEDAFNKYQERNKIIIEKNKQKEIIFHLKRENETILLDKYSKTRVLNLKEGDLIIVSFKEKIKDIKNVQRVQNVSSANLNEEISSNSNSNSSGTPKRKIFVLF